MKKTIIFGIFAVANLLSTAQAGDYTQAVARREYCHTMSMVADHVYSGKGYGRVKKDFYDSFASSLQDGARNADVWRFAIDYSYDKATDLDNAKRMTWAYCMDNAS